MEKFLPEGHVPFKFPEVLDNTIISAWLGCKRKAFFAHFLHLKPKQESIHLLAGAAYASALEQFRLSYWSDDSPTKLDVDASLVVALRTLFVKYGYDPDQLEYQESTNKSGERMAEALVRHCRVNYNPKTDNVRPVMIDGKPAVEQSFAIELGLSHPDTGEPILVHGRSDMLVEYNGGKFGFDDKTCSQLGRTWINKWDFRSQFTGYTKGLQDMGHPILGTIIRGHCFLKGDVKFAEAISHRKQWQIDEWFSDVHQVVYEMIQYYQRAQKEYLDGTDKFQLYKMFTASGKFNETCVAYGGCEYQSLCNNEYPHRYLRDFRIRVWDPRNPEREEG